MLSTPYIGVRQDIYIIYYVIASPYMKRRDYRNVVALAMRFCVTAQNCPATIIMQ